MSEQKEYTDEQGRKFYYERGSRIYLDRGKDNGASVKVASVDGFEGFTKKGPVWHKSIPLNTSFGDFSVQLIGGKSDAKMVKLAASATEYVQKNIEHVRNIVFAHYQWAVKTWGADLVRNLGMPEKVDQGSILSFIPDRAIMVDKMDDDYVCSISFDIPYDPEHGLQLEFEDGSIVSVNGSEFTIEDDCLKFG